MCKSIRVNWQLHPGHRWSGIAFWQRVLPLNLRLQALGFPLTPSLTQ